MIQAIMKEPFAIALEEAQAPKPSADEVLVRIARIGICASDMQIYHGKHKYAKMPMVIGHEACGTVEEVGSSVSGFAVGDRVVIQPQLVCGECYPCSIGRMNVCENLRVMGVHTDGFAAALVALAPKMLHICPPDMDFDKAILAEPMAVAVGAVRRASYEGANIAVIGAGIIGNLIAQVAQIYSGKPALITDVQENRLKIAKQCGIVHTANATAPLKDTIEAIFGRRKADVIIDAAATARTFHESIAAARPASEIIITGNYKEEMAFEVPLIQRREVNLIGHMMYTPDDFAEAVRLLAGGDVKTDALVSKSFELNDIAEAFKFVDDNTADIMKVVVEI
ncbi:MAG: alcohol dehydrogenase catalytic domain-containing protein [Defluviitaleaceae bacterium]|nr:alcohol dehydrogenase catalytic domain-containing protein [Defluviitaleaceae bacterium]